MRKKVTLTDKEKVKVLLMEVDYHLMCLFEAIGSSQVRAIASEKRILRELHRRLEELGHWSSEAQGIQVTKQS